MQRCKEQHCDWANRCQEILLRKRKPPVEMQSAGSHTAEQDSWAAAAASWQVKPGENLAAPSKEVLSSTETKFQLFTPVLAGGRNPPVVPDASPILHSTPTPLTLIFPLHSHVLPGCGSREADRDVSPHQCIQAGLLEPCATITSWHPQHGWNGDYELPHHAVGPSEHRTAGWEGEQHCTLCFTP